MKSSSFILRRSATILAVSVLTLTLLAAITGGLLAFYYPQYGTKSLKR